MPTPQDRLRRLFETSSPARYGGAGALFLLSLLARILLDALMVGSLGMAFFYPAVILAAYWLGARPAIFTAGLSTVAVLAFRATSGVPMDSMSWVILLLFVGTSALAIYLMDSIRTRLRDISDRSERAEALSLSQADLFRDHSERVTNHLQLIAAILELRASGEIEGNAARVLTNAASRTLLISRMHRDFAGGADRTIDITAFVRRLVQASVGASGRQVEVRGAAIQVPLEHATGLGLVLLDRLNASTGLAAVDIQRDGDRLDFRMAVEPLTPTSPSPRDILLLEAVASQLRGRLELDGDGDLSVVRLDIPASLQPPPAWAPLEQAVH